MVDCYRCGRLGHFAAQCTHESHKDGGPIRERTGGVKSDASGGKPAEAAYVVLSGIDICGLETNEDPLQINDPWRSFKPIGKSQGATGPCRLNPGPRTMPTRRGNRPGRITPPLRKLNDANASADDIAAAMARKFPGEAVALAHKIIEVTQAMKEEEKQKTLGRLEAYEQSCAAHFSGKKHGGQGPLSPKNAERFKKNDPSTESNPEELNPENASPAGQADSELCNFEQDEKEKENLKPRESERGPVLRRNGFGVWVDTGFRGPGR